jgi:hypothetical protein
MEYPIDPTPGTPTRPSSNEIGVSFAPTFENALDGSRRGSMEGLQQAMKIISLRLPRVIGARPIAPASLLQSPGAGGADPYGGAVIQTLMQALGLNWGSRGTDAGPNPVGAIDAPVSPTMPMPGPLYNPVGPVGWPPSPPLPRIHPVEGPGGGFTGSFDGPGPTRSTSFTRQRGAQIV